MWLIDGLYGEMEWIEKIFWSVIATILALIPTWLFLGLRHLLSPEGFLENLLMYGFGYWVFGGVQFILLVVLLLVLYFLWTYNP